MPVRVQNRIPAVRGAFHAGVRDRLTEGAKIYRDAAKALAPVDSGDLKDSIRLARLVITPRGYRVAVFTDMPYAAFQEFGTGIYGEPKTAPHRQTAWTYYDPDYGFVTTRGNPPQPFMRPAYEDTRFEVEQAMRYVL